MRRLNLLISSSYVVLWTLGFLITAPTSLARSGNNVSLETLLHMENQLQQIVQKNIADGFGNEDFFKYFNEGSTNPDKKTFQKQEEWYQRQLIWNDFYDNYIIAKQTYIVETTYQQLKDLYKPEDLDPDSQAGILFDKLTLEYKTWKKNRKMLGKHAMDESSRRRQMTDSELQQQGLERLSSQQLQKKRIYGFYYFFNYAKYLKLAAEGKYEERVVKSPSFSLSGAAGLVMFSALRLGVWAARMVGWKTPGTNFASWFTRGINRYFSKDFKNVSVEGTEHLEYTPAKNADRFVNLIIPSHRNAAEDLNLLASLNLSSHILFANAKVLSEMGGYYGGHMAKTIASLPEMVAVGPLKGSRDLRAPDKLRYALKRGIGPNVVNYAQGFTSDFHEILEITPQFTAKLINPLVQDGYTVRLVPVSYETKSKFLGDFESDENKNPGVIVNKPLNPVLLNYMLNLELSDEKGFEKLISVFIRSTWHRTITKYGELSLEEISSRVLEKTGVSIPFAL